MSAFYNERDKYAAQWLRNLIAAGEIAPGVVDERDIRDIRPDELLGYTQCHFFAGIAGWSRALRLAGISDDTPAWTGSCPCQPFSAAGKRGGFDDDRHLWPAWFHLISQCKPPKIFGEQVASPDALKWFDLVQPDLEAAGYAVGVTDLCAASVGSPHIRQRLWFVADSIGIKREGRDSEHGVVSIAQGRGQAAELAGLGSACGMANANSDGRAENVGSRAYEAPAVPGINRTNEPCAGESWRAGSADDGLGNTISPRLEGHAGNVDGAPGRSQQTGSIAEAGGVSGLGNADGQSTGRDTGSPHTTQVEHGSESRDDHGLGYAGSSVDTRPGPLNGFWRDADWLYCRDGKWRPVEPGLEPLAHGLPVSLGKGSAGLRRLAEVAGLDAASLKRAKSSRIGSLRGYGNAIVPELAATFIRACS